MKRTAFLFSSVQSPWQSRPAKLTEKWGGIIFVSAFTRFFPCIFVGKIEQNTSNQSKKTLMNRRKVKTYSVFSCHKNPSML